MTQRAPLLRRLRKIDPEAADWLRDEAPKLGKEINYTDGWRLGMIMIWHSTPQGHDYWAKLARLLGGG